MGKCKFTKRIELDNILAKTKYSSTNKALMTYFNSGLTFRMVELIAPILRTDIPHEDVRVLGFILYNKARNGAPILGYEGYYPEEGISWEDRFIKEPEFMKEIYKSVRKSTLESWREAINLIDKYKEDKGKLERSLNNYLKTKSERRTIWKNR